MADSNRRRGQGNPKIIFVVTEDWYFLSHRGDLGRACRDMGWDVVVATRVQADGDRIRDEGFRVIPLRLLRRDRAPWREIPSFFELVMILLRERPDILHLVGLKPVIYGSLAAILVPPGAVVNALAGLGYIFTSGRPLVVLARAFVKIVLRLCMRRPNHWLIVQNDHDASVVVESRMIESDHLAVIKGSGVDLDRFAPTPEPDGPVVVAVVCRMLKDKGVREVVLAARVLREQGNPVRIWLVGAPDPDNPTSLDEETLRQWHLEGCIEWLGHQVEIPEIWSKAHIAVLPSYREGLPKSLLEAAACGRPIVTADVPGCNDLVENNVTGFTVPPQNWVELADAIGKLAQSPELRAQMGARIRAHVVAELGVREVVRQTLEFYRKALGPSDSRSLLLEPETLDP